MIMEIVETKTQSVVLITGATSGIGLALARLFARDKHDVFLVARDEEQLKAVQKDLSQTYGVTVYYACGDLADRHFVATLPALVHEKQLVVSCLVNNAGSGVQGAFAETDWEKEITSFELIAYAPTYLSKVFLSDLIQNQGKILNVISTSAYAPGNGMAVYSAGKAYLLSFSESLSLELASQGVTVTALVPGPTRTGFQSANGLGELPTWRFPSAEAVASFGYRALQKNKTVAIHGLRNRIIYLILKYTPRFIVRMCA